MRGIDRRSWDSKQEDATDATDATDAKMDHARCRERVSFQQLSSRSSPRVPDHPRHMGHMGSEGGHSPFKDTPFMCHGQKMDLYKCHQSINRDFYILVAHYIY